MDDMPEPDPATYGRHARLDRQSLAFRENDVHVPDDQLADLAEAIHPAATSLAGIRLPADHEAEDWDAERTGPKTLTEARVQLAERIADPAAPDGHEVAGAYDDLDGES